MASYLITGSSRGIGLGYVTVLARKDVSEVSKIFAAARSESAALKELIAESAGRVEFVPLEVTSEESAKDAAKQVERSLGGKGLDVLINNAGIPSHTDGGIQNMTDLTQVLNVNVFGVHNVTRAFLPLLKKGQLKKIANISSSLGSMALSAMGKFQPTPAYKVSKAAVNMLTVQWAESLESNSFVVLAICPGWAKTDMGTDAGHLTAEESATGGLNVLLTRTVADSGKFFVVDLPGKKIDGQEIYNGSVRPY
ncbi:short-chain dehydrogenase/reductase SDR [Boeremia exigua]|uniref:short-chain dehydrogenase/reductase SDR n=1 Tax=Boeremia exigua TaxID=749465 RepID=UPI001E8E4717|nr:short-chain dehydrogenase/reductase SDR [Boeremia exigua]KAH6613148.1 short-chain dehydrogenase/reductase SDR [Boeremia exigua]